MLISQLQVFSPPVAIAVPKLDPKRCQLGVTTPRWSSNLLTTYGRADTQAGPRKVSAEGHDPKMVFKSSQHSWPCRCPSWTLKGVNWGSPPQDGLQVFSLLAPKLDLKRCQLGVTTPRWSLGLLATCDRASTQVGL